MKLTESNEHEIILNLLKGVLSSDFKKPIERFVSSNKDTKMTVSTNIDMHCQRTVTFEILNGFIEHEKSPVKPLMRLSASLSNKTLSSHNRVNIINHLSYALDEFLNCE